MHSVSLINRQKEVQRKLGRNMLLLQHYELSLKKLLPRLNLSGTLETLESNHQLKIANIQKKTLGQLVGEFLEDAVTVVTEENSLESTDYFIDTCNGEFTQPYFNFRFRFGFPEEERQRLSDTMTDLIARRNELVHHFLAKFDLQTPDSCSAAESYLDETYAVFKNHQEQLKSLIDSLQNYREKVTEFLSSPECERCLIHGITSDGSVNWPYSSIVSSLRKVWKDLNQDGWINLDVAITSIKKQEPDLSPGLFGCKSWRQLLKRSQLFELRLAHDANTGRGECWFRPKLEELHGETSQE